jgi:peptidoglycan/xylan/chitin deacetylase (PgdA/CDA1 family)
MKRTLKTLYRFTRNIIDRPAIILLYHRVFNLTSDPQQLAVSPENFNDQIRFLRSNYSLIGIEEFENNIVRGKKNPARCVVLTFDDGYADNYYDALPILERHNAQALFYIATGNLDTAREFWWDDLERIFLGDHHLPSRLQVVHQGRSIELNTSSQAERTNTYHALHPLVKALTFNDRSALMKNITDWSGLSHEGRASHRMMTTPELILTSKSPAAVIGAHTHTHSRLSVCSPEEQRMEISQSKSILENLLHKKITHFSYPFGTREDYTTETVNICRDLGFTMVCSNYHDQVHSWHSRFELPRMLVRNWALTEFKKKMHTFFTY